MKNSDNPITALQAQRDAAIRNKQRTKDLAETTKSWKRIESLAKALLSEVLNVTVGPPVIDSDFREVDEPAPAPQRKAVTASAVHIDAAWGVLCNTKPRYSELTAKNVAAVWDGPDGELAGAYRLAGAALKFLVADGRATVKRGKYAQVEKVEAKPADNGAAIGTP